MNEIMLYTNDGHEVQKVTVPPWKFPPELIVWGERFFLRREAKLGIEVRIKPRDRDWDDEGRTVYLPRDEVATAGQARTEVMSWLAPGWEVEAVIDG